MLAKQTLALRSAVRVRVDNLRLVLTRTDRRIIPTVMLAVVAGQTHFLSAPVFHSFLHCQSPITAISLESLEKIRLLLWLTSLQQIFFCRVVYVCLCYVQMLCWLLLFNQDKRAILFGNVFLFGEQHPNILTFASITVSPFVFSPHSKQEQSKRKNLSATPYSRRSRPYRRRRRPWRSTMRKRRNFSLMNCQGNSCR